MNIKKQSNNGVREPISDEKVPLVRNMLQKAYFQTEVKNWLKKRLWQIPDQHQLFAKQVKSSENFRTRCKQLQFQLNLKFKINELLSHFPLKYYQTLIYYVIQKKLNWIFKKQPERIQYQQRSLNQKQSQIIHYNLKITSVELQLAYQLKQYYLKYESRLSNSSNSPEMTHKIEPTLPSDKKIDNNKMIDQRKNLQSNNPFEQTLENSDLQFNDQNDRKPNRKAYEIRSSHPASSDWLTNCIQNNKEIFLRNANFRFRYQSVMMYSVCIVGLFFQDYFNRLDINRQFKSEVYIIINYAFLGFLVSPTVYHIMAKKYLRNQQQKKVQNLNSVFSCKILINQEKKQNIKQEGNSRLKKIFVDNKSKQSLTISMKSINQLQKIKKKQNKKNVSITLNNSPAKNSHSSILSANSDKNSNKTLNKKSKLNLANNEILPSKKNFLKQLSRFSCLNAQNPHLRLNSFAKAQIHFQSQSLRNFKNSSNRLGNPSPQHFHNPPLMSKAVNSQKYQTNWVSQCENFQEEIKKCLQVDLLPMIIKKKYNILQCQKLNQIYSLKEMKKQVKSFNQTNKRYDFKSNNLSTKIQGSSDFSNTKIEKKELKYIFQKNRQNAFTQKLFYSNKTTSILNNLQKQKNQVSSQQIKCHEKIKSDIEIAPFHLKNKSVTQWNDAINVLKQKSKEEQKKLRESIKKLENQSRDKDSVLHFEFRPTEQFLSNQHSNHFFSQIQKNSFTLESSFKLKQALEELNILNQDIEPKATICIEKGIKSSELSHMNEKLSQNCSPYQSSTLAKPSKNQKNNIKNFQCLQRKGFLLKMKLKEFEAQCKRRKEVINDSMFRSKKIKNQVQVIEKQVNSQIFDEIMKQKQLQIC